MSDGSDKFFGTLLFRKGEYSTKYVVAKLIVCRGEYIVKELLSQHKKMYISRLSDELPMLRAKAGVTQAELANLIGISRQTYCAMETGVKEMSWSTYLSLIFIYDSMPSTSQIIRKLGIYPEGLLVNQ